MSIDSNSKYLAKIFTDVDSPWSPLETVGGARCRTSLDDLEKESSEFLDRYQYITTVEASILFSFYQSPQNFGTI